MTRWRYWLGLARFVLSLGPDDGWRWAWRTWPLLVTDPDAGIHLGDCTRVAQTCTRCLVRHYAGLPYDGPPPRTA